MMNPRARLLMGCVGCAVILLGCLDTDARGQETGPPLGGAQTVLKRAVENLVEPPGGAGPAEEPPSKSRMLIEHGGKALLSISFFDVDVREALSALALEREINVVMSSAVSGKVSLHLHQATLEEAMDAICLAGGFGYHKKEGLYYFYKPKEARDPVDRSLVTRLFKLRYAGTDQLQDILSALPGSGTIKIHDATKSVLVEDTEENLHKFASLIAQWDAMPKQVMIEAKILQVSLTDEMSFGVNWEKLLGDVLNSDARIGTGGFSTALPPGAGGGVSPIPVTGKGVFANLITGAGSADRFTAALDALQTKTRVETLSTPKILAIHGKEAKVQVGGRQGYKVTTTNVGVATESVQFIDTGTILEITPYVDDQNNVLLKVKPSINAAKIEQGIPVVSSTEVSTWLLAKDGQTVFIGGLIEDSKTKTRDFIPCVGNIPGLNLLFGRVSRNIGKSELIVLITPQVLDWNRDASGAAAVEKTKKAQGSLAREPRPLHRELIEN